MWFVLVCIFHGSIEIVIHFSSSNPTIVREKKTIVVSSKHDRRISDKKAMTSHHAIKPSTKRGANRHSPKIVDRRKDTRTNFFSSDACRCNRFMFANTKPCKQTLKRFFSRTLSETIIISFTALRQLNTKLYSIIVVGVEYVFFFVAAFYLGIDFYFFFGL